MEEIHKLIRELLEKKPTEAELTDYVNHLQPPLKPTHKLHQLPQEGLNANTVVYARLMVQDLRDDYFYYSFIMKKPFEPAALFHLYKFGLNPTVPPQEEDQLLEGDNYLRVMTKRTPVIVTPMRYPTQWVLAQQAGSVSLDQLELLVDEECEFKLGEVINVVANYDHEHKKLYFLRKVDQKEAEEQGLDWLTTITKETVDYPNVRQELLHFLSNFMAEHYAEFLLALLLTDQPLFLGCQANISQLLDLLVPRLNELQLRHPCEDSLFPYKDQQGRLMLQPMQMSNERTMVVIDFSNFSNEGKVEINEKEINNLKALKVFVEEGKTIYRWEVGESLVDHNHFGLIVRGTTIITPHFNPPKQSIAADFTPIAFLPAEVAHKFRVYLLSALQFKPKLNEQQRLKVEKALAEEQFKEKLGTSLAKIMQLSKLRAKSYGRDVITYEDFDNSRRLLSLQ